MFFLLKQNRFMNILLISWRKLVFLKMLQYSILVVLLGVIKEIKGSWLSKDTGNRTI